MLKTVNHPGVQNGFSRRRKPVIYVVRCLFSPPPALSSQSAPLFTSHKSLAPGPKLRILKAWSASWVGVGVGDRDQSCTPTQRQTLRTPVGTVGEVGGRRSPTGLLGEAKYSSPIFTTVACHILAAQQRALLRQAIHSAHFVLLAIPP